MSIYKAQFDHLAMWDEKSKRWKIWVADCSWDYDSVSGGGTGTFSVTSENPDVPVVALAGRVTILPIRVVKEFALGSLITGIATVNHVEQDDEGVAGSWTIYEAKSGAVAFEAKLSMGDPELIEKYGILPEDTDWERIQDELDQFDRNLIRKD